MSANANEQLMAVAFVCDNAGTLIQVLYDGMGISTNASPARTLVELVHPDCAEKARSFLVSLRQQQAAFSWELNVVSEPDIKLLHFAGCVVDAGLLIIAATTPFGLTSMCERLVAEYGLPALQQVVDSKAHQLADVERYDELTLLNSELMTLQRELVKRTIELERSNEQKNEFIGMAAHDLRNPLQVITGYSRLLLRDAFGALTVKQRETISTISRNSDFMLKLITDLLHISSIEAGKLQLDLQPADIVELIRKNVQFNRLLAQQKEIDVRLSCDEEQLTLLIDTPKIENVLNNLLQNAIKFSHPRTVVTVGLKRTDRAAEISVHDEGLGIPAAEMDRLFKPFEKMSVRSTGGEPSTGLGLAIAKRIVVGHQGVIWAESEPGAGSTFYVQLPLQQ
jgi:signal transduction histidine kinase